jgi:hypothetical protein
MTGGGGTEGDRTTAPVAARIHEQGTALSTMPSVSLSLPDGGLERMGLLDCASTSADPRYGSVRITRN